MKTLCFLALAVLLCGCKDNPKAAEVAPKVAPQTVPPPTTDPRPEIACFGDSLTAGFGLETGQSYPDVLQAELDRQGYRYRVVNFGVSGDTTQDGLARLRMVLVDKPRIVVLELGANDGLRGQPVEAIKQNLAQLIEGLQGSGAKVVLAGMTLPPNYGPAYIEKFRAAYTDLSRRYNLVSIPFLLQGVGGNNSLMQRDGLHPNAEGARIVAATVLKTLTPLLKK
jgi:acyl-CoA thioesterase I